MRMVIVLCLLLMAVILLVKNDVTYRNMMVITNAIRDYRYEEITENNPIFVDYDDMGSYLKVLFRIWDWGYENILPPDKYVLIAPYIKPYKGNKKKN